MFTKDPSFRIGCGRYLQSRGALKQTAEEIKRLGASPLFISGKTAWSVAGGAIIASLEEAEMPFAAEIYTGFCNIEAAEEYARAALADGRDVILGVGGGVMMDFAKLVARAAALPLINIPTSVATCAAYTPLSVCYTAEGRTVGTVHHQAEVACVLADTEILLNEPPRLLLAGVFDSMAKFSEIRHWYREGDASYPLGIDYAYALALRSFGELSGKTAAALAAIAKGEVSEAFEQAVFTLIAATGVISGIARGSQQTALAHKFYEITRALYPVESKPYLHGELVGIGLLLQNEYNGERERNAALLSLMRAHGMPSSPAEAGVPGGEETASMYYETIIGNKKMKEIDGARLRDALVYLWRNKE